MSSKISGVGSSWFSVSASFATKLSSILTLGDACHRDLNQLLQHKNRKVLLSQIKSNAMLQLSKESKFLLHKYLCNCLKHTTGVRSPPPPKLSSEFVLKLGSFSIKPGNCIKNNLYIRFEAVPKSDLLRLINSFYLFMKNT